MKGIKKFKKEVEEWLDPKVYYAWSKKKKKYIAKRFKNYNDFNR